MRPFAFEAAKDVEAAIAAAGADRQGQVPTRSAAQFIAGGTNLADYMKLGIPQVERLVDVNKIAEPDLGRISVDEQGLRLGALVRMAEAEENRDIKRHYPVIADSLRYAASAQIRNMASLAGNILQRTRCEYFREASWPCNKREPGSGCSAIGGFNRMHAVLGTSDACIATYHGDFAQALIALDATVETKSSKGARKLPFAELHKLPGD